MQILFCDERHLPLIEGVSGELAAEEPEQNGTRLDFDSRSMTEIMLDPRSSAFVPE